MKSQQRKGLRKMRNKEFIEQLDDLVSDYSVVNKMDSIEVLVLLRELASTFNANLEQYFAETECNDLRDNLLDGLRKNVVGDSRGSISFLVESASADVAAGKCPHRIADTATLLAEIDFHWSDTLAGETLDRVHGLVNAGSWSWVDGELTIDWRPA